MSTLQANGIAVGASKSLLYLLFVPTKLGKWPNRQQSDSAPVRDRMVANRPKAGVLHTAS